MLVVVYHYLNFQGVAIRSWQAYSLVPLRLGWSGVDLFFVLSGFLIGGILYDAKNSERYYRTFYSRRISRILPLYFTGSFLFTSFGLRSSWQACILSGLTAQVRFE